MKFMERDFDEEITFDKLGDAFRYVITTELPILAKNHGDGNAPHFYAVLSYMYLNNLVSNYTASRSHMTMLLESEGAETIKDVIVGVSKLLLEDLKKQIGFSNFDELIEQLNQFTMDRWYFDIGRQLIYNYELDSYLFNGMLYYIGRNKKGNDKALLRISVKRINSKTDLSDDGNSELLADGFEDTLAFDDKYKRIYLKMYDQERYFAYYDILKAELVICRNRFLAVIDGMLWVITQDNWIAAVMGDRMNRIKAHHEGEYYEARKDCFFVRPTLSENSFFYPYYLFFDGRILLADKKDYRNILWEYLSEDIFDNKSDLFAEIGYDMIHEEKAIMPKEFSIDEIMESLNDAIPRESRCTNFKYILFENILNILRNYLDPTKDYTKLWFTLGEANSCLSRDGSFPSEELFWRLKEIDEENSSGEKSLLALLMNEDSLLVELVKEKKYDSQLDFNDEILYENEVTQDASSKIGTFVRNKDNIYMVSIPYEEGMFVGSQIVPKTDLSCEIGVVTYDARLQRSSVICYYELDMNERLKIMQEFNLSRENTTFVIHKNG